MTFDPAQLDSITGYLLPNEAALLYRLASEVPAGGTIVEIGSYQGKSTVALGLGVKTKPYTDAVLIYAIDPHMGEMKHGARFDIFDQVELFKNLLRFEVADVVNVVSMPSVHIAQAWCYGDIELLWIDGAHDYQDVTRDIQAWSKWLSPSGKMAFHDYANPDFPGVRQAVNEFLAAGQWRIREQVDTIVALERANK